MSEDTPCERTGEPADLGASNETPRVLMAVTPSPAPRCAACGEVIPSPMMGWVDERPQCKSCTADPWISTSIEIASRSLELAQTEDMDSFRRLVGACDVLLLALGYVLTEDLAVVIRMFEWLEAEAAKEKYGKEGQGADEDE